MLEVISLLNLKLFFLIWLEVGYEVVSMCVDALQKQFKMAVKDVVAFVTLTISCSAESTHRSAVLAKSSSLIVINLVSNTL
jgi:hypothetical protein